MTDKLTTNFNVSPFHDDFDEDKQYVKILFRPSNAIQARELTQIQSILQNQIGRFGDHVFKEGSVVDGVKITYYPKQDVVYFKNKFNTNTTASITSIENDWLAVSANTDVRASVKVVKPGFEAQYPDANRFYIDYIKTGKDGSNNDVSKFESGEEITIYTNVQDKLGTLDANNVYDTINVITSNATVNSVGVAYAASISEGIVYQKSYFSKVNKQTVIVKEHDQNVTNYAIGFKSTEEVINEDIDPTLNDNAVGSENENAPGAHRLKINPVLISVDKTTLANGSTFLPIAEFDGDHPVEEHTESVYNKLGDEFSKRTYEESGDYVVKPFQIESFSHESNTALMKYEISPGIAYAKGARVELIGSKKVDVERAIETDVSEQQIVTTSYGNYVIVNEYSGVFNYDSLNAIDIYDTAQNTLTDIENVDSSPTGSKIGTANIRGIKYISGTKGTASATYHLYLFNIEMNSGKSFSTDAKAFYSAPGTYGAAKADIVLENSKAVIKEPDKNNLVFDLGTLAAKRLTNANGVNDTQFVFIDTASATLQSNGFVTFTLNTPYAGGNEKLNHSVGALSETLEDQYTITVSDSAYTANLAGTISVTGTTVTGTGTAFDDNFHVGSFIRQASSADIRRVTSITNATSMEINSTMTASSVNYQYYLPKGKKLNLNDSNGSIEIISNTQFSVSTGLTIDSGTQTVYAEYPVLRTTAVPIKKEINKDIYVKISAASDQQGPWNLGLVDVTSVEGIYVGTSYSESNPDRKDWFVIDSGQTDHHYGHAKLVLKPAFASKITSSTRILIKLNHLTANNSAGVGFFSVDSYPFIQEGDTANSTNIHIASLSSYKDLDLRNVIDFRPQKYNTANSSSTIGNATENPSAANSSYIVSSSGAFTPDNDSNFQCDVEYYLPRIDLVSITPEGTIDIKKGVADENPKTPFSDSDSMVIGSVFVPAYPSLTTRESEIYRRPDISTLISLMMNKGYNMRDIGKLDKRIKRLEYYTVLNTLEKSAKDILIPDSNGLDRFKNGIFANPFNSHKLGAVNDIEYKIAIDKDEGVGRPFFKQRPVDYKLDNATLTNAQVTNKLVTLPYTAENFIKQTYASKFRNCTESVWSWRGNVTLYPDYDHFRDESRLPAVNVDLDLASPWRDFADTPFGSNFGDWRVISNQSSTSTVNIGGRSWRQSGNRITELVDSISTTNRTVSERDIQRINVETDTNNYEFGSFVKDITMNPYMRSREVAFVASGLKPNTRMYVFFDDVDVSSSCANGVLSGITNVEQGQENRIVTRTGEYGANLISDSSGNLIGVFKIPEGQFRNGERVLQIVDVDDLETGGDASISNAKAVYTASALSLTSQNISLTTATPKITSSSSTQQTVNISNSTRVRVTRTSVRERDNDRDPIAQSFLINVNDNITGVHIPKIGVYFKSKDSTLGVTCYLVETDSGDPDTSRILASKHLDASDVNVSDDASLETVFEFDRMAYTMNNKYYAFMIKPDGDSPEYKIWLSELGGTDITTNQQIFSNPYVGVTFISANMNSWTAIQGEDIKFNIYRAKFTSLTGSVEFDNEDDEYLTINGLTKVDANIPVTAGDIVRTLDANGDILTSNTDPVAYIQSVDEANNTLILDSSNGGFSSNTVIEIHREFKDGETSLNSNTLIANTTIESVDDINYSVLVPRFGYIEPVNTKISYSFKGYDTTNNPDGAFKNVEVDNDYEFKDKLRKIYSKSNEINNLTGNKSGTIKVNLESTNDYSSPVIDLSRKSVLHIENIINNDSSNEHTKYGNALTKYVSPRVELAKGQDSEDLQVYLTAYRPVGSSIKIYGKFQNAEDSGLFDDKVWTELEITEGAGTYSSPLDDTNYIEYTYGIPNTVGVSQSVWLNSSNDDVAEYADSTGARYVGFKYFAIKIVLLSDNSVTIPKIDSVSAISLQV